MDMNAIGRSTKAPAADSQGKRIALQYPALDGLRGLAILAVMLYHFTGGYKGSNFILHAWSGFADAGWMGVDLFFVLSGFLITGILYDTALAENRIRNFYARRALRIFPLFYGSLFLLLLLTPVFHFHWQWGHALFFFYLGNMTGIFSPGLGEIQEGLGLGHLWSLAVEEQFYLLWPFVVWNIHNRHRLLQIIAVVLVGAPILRILLIWQGMEAVNVGYLLFTRADSLLVGGSIALLVRGPSRTKLPAKSIFWGALLVLVGVLILSGGPKEGPWMTTVGYTAIALASACLVFMAQSTDTLACRMFSNQFMRFFGRYSYGLYIFHGLFFVYLRHKAVLLQNYFESSALAQILTLLVGFAVSLLLAMISFHFFEAPLLKLKSRFSTPE